MESKSKGPIRRTASRLVGSIRRTVRHVRRMLFDPMYPAYRRWIADDGDHTLRLDYPLSSQSLVFDVGGYKGEWCAEMVRRYGCRVFVFEPVPSFAKALEKRFADSPLVHVFDFGLSDKDEEVEIAVAGDKSGIYRDDGDAVRARLRDVVGFLEEQGVERVDLAKINIEGGEFPLLRSLIDSGQIAMFVALQVQFHSFVEDAVRHRKRILQQLEATHRPTWSYPFVWENWVRLNDDQAVSDR